MDDILGTFWKLDTQGDTQKSPVVSIPEEDEDSSIILPPVVDSLKVIEVDKRMNRSDSEYAFQEFLKVSEERGGSAAVRKSRFMVNQTMSMTMNMTTLTPQAQSLRKPLKLKWSSSHPDRKPMISTSIPDHCHHRRRRRLLHHRRQHPLLWVWAQSVGLWIRWRWGLL